MTEQTSSDANDASQGQPPLEVAEQNDDINGHSSTSSVERTLARLRRRGRQYEDEIFRPRSSATPGQGDTSIHAQWTTSRAVAASDEPASQDYEEPHSIGRFQIVRRLGQGGYGLVFLAYDPRLKRSVALKVPRPEALMTPELRVRFLREAEAAAALNHPNVVPVFETGSDGAICYIASAYVEGMSLAEWLNEAQAVAPRGAAQLIATLADAIQHAHNRGILHRDLKPANVLLARPKTTPVAAGSLERFVPQITDFGLAKIEDVDTGYTHSGSILGTPAYISPEQTVHTSRDVGPASDIYSLGAILYELLAGRPPFQADSLLDLLQAVRQQDPEPFRHAAVPVDLESICLKCLEKQPARRYESATALADDLQRFLAGEPVAARPVTNRERLARWCHRNPLVSGLSAAVLLLVLTLAVGSTIAAVMLAQANRKTLDSLERETLVKDEATENEELALAALYEARFAQAQAKRQSGEVGQRLESLDALAKAAARIPRLKYGEAERRQLRNEALACLPLVDLELDREWPLEWHPRLRTAADAMKEHYAVVDQQQTIVVRGMSDNRITARLQGGKGPHRFIEFSPDGKLLAAVRSLGPIDATLLVWRLSDEKTLHQSKVPTWHSQAIDFHPSGQSLAVARDGGAIEIVNTVSFEVDRTIPGRQTASIVSFSFDGSHLAVVRGGLIEIIDIETRDVTRSIKHSASIFNLAWSADGTRLAAASLNQPVQLWNTAEPAGHLKPGFLDAVPHVAELAQAFSDTESDAPDAVFGQQLAAQITSVGFHPGGKLLWTTGYDGKARLWDLTTGKQVLIGTDFGDFSRDGKWASKVGNTIGRYRVVVPLEHQVLEQPLVAGSATNRAECISIHPQGRILAASKDQLVLWDLGTMQPVATAPSMGTFAKFDPTGEFLVVVGRQGLTRRPVKYEETDKRLVLTIGSPEQLVPNSEWRGYLAISDDGKSIASADRYTLHRVQIFDVERGTKAVLAPRHDNAKWLDMTSDGRRMVTGTWHGKDVKVWDVESHSVVKTISATKARVRFSPDGKLLVVDEGYRYSIWNTDTWEPIRHHVPRPQGTVPNPIAFSADGRILAVLAERDVIVLLDTSSFEEIAKLPGVVAIDQLLFSPDSSQLIATTASNMNAANKHFVHVWDLDRVRGRLQAMDLDWDHPPLAAQIPADPNQWS